MNFIQCLQIPCLNWPWECFCSVPVVLVHSHFCQCCGCTELASSFATQNDSWYVTFHLKNWWFDGKWVHRNSYRGSVVSSSWRMILLSKPLASICRQWKGVKCCGGCCNFACCPYFSIDVLQCTETNNTKYFLRSSWVSFYLSKIFWESHPTYMIDSFHTKNNLSLNCAQKLNMESGVRKILYSNLLWIMTSFILFAFMLGMQDVWVTKLLVMLRKNHFFLLTQP